MLIRASMGVAAVTSVLLLTAAPEPQPCLESRTVSKRTLAYVNHGGEHQAWVHVARDMVGTGPGLVEVGPYPGGSTRVVQRVPEDSAITIGVTVASGHALWLSPGTPGSPPSDKPGLRFIICFGR